jgi:hypothetical protein
MVAVEWRAIAVTAVAAKGTPLSSGDRRERPRPEAMISLFEAYGGCHYQRMATDTHAQLPFLEARHRAHDRVENRAKEIEQIGMGRDPSREFGINESGCSSP